MCVYFCLIESIARNQITKDAIFRSIRSFQLGGFGFVLQLRFDEPCTIFTLYARTFTSRTVLMFSIGSNFSRIAGRECIFST